MRCDELRLTGSGGANRAMEAELKRLVMRSPFDVRVPKPRREGEAALIPETVAAVHPTQASGYLALVTVNGMVRCLRHHLFGEHMRPGSVLVDIAIDQGVLIGIKLDGMAEDIAEQHRETPGAICEGDCSSGTRQRSAGREGSGHGGDFAGQDGQHLVDLSGRCWLAEREADACHCTPYRHAHRHQHVRRFPG